jgi:hypothetical protein
LFLTLLEGNAQGDARNESRNEGQEECVIRRATCHERQPRTYAVQSNSGFSKVWTWKQNGEEPLRQIRHEAQHVVGEKVRHGRYISRLINAAISLPTSSASVPSTKKIDRNNKNDDDDDDDDKQAHRN